MADAQPKAQQRRGRLFDGQTARPHAVIVQRASDGLMLVRIDGEEMLAWHDLRRSKDGLSLTDPGRPDWRISLTEPLPADWQALVAQTGGISEDDRRRVGIAVV
ncbi:hypothetical protein, partial [Sandarakinorhabdus sp.]|uniref:DUF7092 domain-containing protein n=1 Tax=Sandarakinorhabdus sp. TaxID=1916663 RepID=UPI00333FEEB1